MNNKFVRVALFVVLALGVIGFGYGFKLAAPIEREVSGKIVSLDVATRRGEFEFVHPKNGQPIKLVGDIAPECAITIDGATANLADLRVGESARIYGRLSRLSGEVVAQRVQVERAGRSSSQPSSVPTISTP